MKRRFKGRHAIGIVLALTWFAISVWALADFSGRPAPRWRSIALKVMPFVCLATLGLNAWLDHRARVEK